ncbi:MAG: DUF6114 domain-containing protein [Micromonosporaceae bacterium]
MAKHGVAGQPEAGSAAAETELGVREPSDTGSGALPETTLEKGVPEQPGPGPHGRMPGLAQRVQCWMRRLSWTGLLGKARAVARPSRGPGGEAASANQATPAARTPSAEAQAPSAGEQIRATALGQAITLRQLFRRWRQTRPFWAGLFAMAGGVEILLLPLGPLPVVFRMGIGALGGILIGISMVLAGVFLWRQPDRQMRQFLALFVGLFSVASFVISNFGGFLVGMMLGIVGACLAYGWHPLPDPEPADDDEPDAAPQDDSGLRPTGVIAAVDLVQPELVGPGGAGADSQAAGAGSKAAGASASTAVLLAFVMIVGGAAQPFSGGEAHAAPPPEAETRARPPGAAAAPEFRLPFPCRQVWEGQTRSDHNPRHAVDFNRAGDEGDLVLASAPGSVYTTGDRGDASYGRYVAIDHAGGYRTYYAHLQDFAVKPGQRVRQGQLIGRVGNTGGSTGAHLHYEQRRHGVAQPVTFDGRRARYWGAQSYTSDNGCGQPESDPDPNVRPGAHPLRITADRLDATRFVYEGVSTIDGPRGPIKAIHLKIKKAGLDALDMVFAGAGPGPASIRSDQMWFHGMELWVTRMKADVRFPLRLDDKVITPDDVPFWLVPKVPLPLRAEKVELSLSYGRIDTIEMNKPLTVSSS